MPTIMHLLFFTPFNNEAGKRLQGIIEGIVPEKNMEIHGTIDSLSQRLRQIPEKPYIAVLIASSRELLSDILNIRKLFRDIRIILILPDRDETTISHGHRLYPRFLSYMDGDFREVAAVLRRMLHHICDEDSTGAKGYDDSFDRIAALPAGNK